MPLTLIIGDLGTGKTLLATILGYNSKFKKVVSNLDLEFPAEKFNVVKFAKSEYSDCCCIIDEAYSLLESRNSMKNINMLSSYVLFQSRKKNLDLYLTVQLFSTLDLRFRSMANVMIFAMGLVEKNGVKFFKYIYQSKKIQKKFYIALDKAKMYFGLYNTNQIIESIDQISNLQKLKTKKEKLKEMESIITELEKLDRKFTKGQIKVFLYENNYPKEYETYIYEKLRDKGEDSFL